MEIINQTYVLMFAFIEKQANIAQYLLGSRTVARLDML